MDTRHVRQVSGAVRVKWETRYVGIPFLDGGRDDKGLDCWGLVRAVYHDCLGVDLPTYGEINASDLLRVRRQIAEGSVSETWREVVEPREFDVAVMRLPSGKGFGHVGVMLDARRVLHVERASATVIERIDTVIIRNRIMGFWRHVRDNRSSP